MKQVSQKSNQREGGQVMLVITLFLLIGSLAIVATLMTLVRSQLLVTRELTLSKETFILTEGALEDVVYRHKNARTVSATETLSEGAITVVTTTTNTADGKIVLAVGNEDGRIRKMRSELIEGDGASFSFGVQTHNGGIILENSSFIDGNVYSNGSIIGNGNNPNQSLIKGTAISAGPSGYIFKIHATGSAYAHELVGSKIDGDAFYTTIDAGTFNNTAGSKNPGSPDLATTTLPIPDSLIDSWAEYASSSNVLNAECASAGGHIIFNTDVTLGPAKIPCDVTFTGNGTTKTISGVLWIEGNLTLLLGPEYTIHPGIGNKSVPIIVDNPANRLTSGKIDMSNSGEWFSNGNRSYIMLISRNESAEKGGIEKAIAITNSTGGKLLLYAGHGEVTMRNSVSLTMITAWRLRLQQSTSVKYDSGLASSVFTAGPGGSYVIESWQEVQ